MRREQAFPLQTCSPQVVSGVADGNPENEEENPQENGNYRTLNDNHCALFFSEAEHKRGKAPEYERGTDESDDIRNIHTTSGRPMELGKIHILPIAKTVRGGVHAVASKTMAGFITGDMSRKSHEIFPEQLRILKTHLRSRARFAASLCNALLGKVASPSGV